jgi:PKHD-type hydroxylase
MNLSNYYWAFQSALSPKLCDDIIRYGLSKPESMAKTGGYDKPNLTEEDVLNIQEKRKSDIVWLSDTWIYREIHPYIHRANKDAGWNFEWSRSEHCQFTKYKLNQYYDWHCDSWNDVYNKPNTPEFGMTRKLSVTCQLTDGSEYEGGELQFDFRNYDPHLRDENKHVVTSKEILPKGSIVVFPSFVWHRVKPVTKGTRYSLVIWNLGYPHR